MVNYKNMKQKLILFDIDGTLLKGKSKIHFNSFIEAFRKIFKIDVNPNEIDHEGKTDMRIILELSEKHGIPKDKVIPRLKEIYKIMIDFYKKNVDLDKEIQPNDNVEKLLSILKKKGYILGLLTGNLKKIARTKIGKFDLNKYFSFGSFGEISEIRSKLLENAIKKAKSKFKTNLNKEDIFVIGDTRFDVECGKQLGVKIIAVATGKYSIEELKKYNPDYVLKDFSDLESIINIIDGSLIFKIKFN
jgi:phosphoglycolate phosphatase-like HAD superfamily hydrolase